jgi:hypothetical protein
MIRRVPIDDAPKDGRPIIGVAKSPSGKGESFLTVRWWQNRWCVLGDAEARPDITEYIVVV